MSVCFTNKNIHVQFIDDLAGTTIAFASTASKATPDREKLAANAVSAKTVGAFAAQAAIGKGIKQVVFDRLRHEFRAVARRSGAYAANRAAILSRDSSSSIGPSAASVSSPCRSRRATRRTAA